MRAFVLFVLLCAGCVSDYRTDQERAQGVVLTVSQVDQREDLRRQRLDLWAEMERHRIDQLRLRRMVYCGSADYASTC